LFFLLSELLFSCWPVDRHYGLNWLFELLVVLIENDPEQQQVNKQQETVGAIVDGLFCFAKLSSSPSVATTPVNFGAGRGMSKGRGRPVSSFPRNSAVAVPGTPPGDALSFFHVLFGFVRYRSLFVCVFVLIVSFLAAALTPSVSPRGALSPKGVAPSVAAPPPATTSISGAVKTLPRNSAVPAKSPRHTVGFAGHVAAAVPQLESEPLASPRVPQLSLPENSPSRLRLVGTTPQELALSFQKMKTLVTDAHEKLLTSPSAVVRAGYVQATKEKQT
jgi:hypothetical protein